MAMHHKNMGKKYPAGSTARKTPNIFVDLSKTKIAERRKPMLQDFKNFNVDAADLDELVALSAFGKQLRGEFEAQKVAVPEYVSDNLNSLAREIDARMADRRATRVRELKAQRDSLKTAQERRDAIDKELAALGEPVGA
jgi:hypothetical protein